MENHMLFLVFFDVNSFDEIMAAWARTVVTGRAKLGGIPCVVIAVETRAIELVLPADPANPVRKRVKVNVLAIGGGDA